MIPVTDCLVCAALGLRSGGCQSNATGDITGGCQSNAIGDITGGCRSTARGDVSGQHPQVSQLQQVICRVTCQVVVSQWP